MRRKMWNKKIICEKDHENGLWPLKCHLANLDPTNLCEVGVCLAMIDSEIEMFFYKWDFDFRRQFYFIQINNSRKIQRAFASFFLSFMRFYCNLSVWKLYFGRQKMLYQAFEWVISDFPRFGLFLNECENS